MELSVNTHRLDVSVDRARTQLARVELPGAISAKKFGVAARLHLLLCAADGDGVCENSLLIVDWRLLSLADSNFPMELI